MISYDEYFNEPIAIHIERPRSQYDLRKIYFQAYYNGLISRKEAMIWYKAIGLDKIDLQLDEDAAYQSYIVCINR